MLLKLTFACLVVWIFLPFFPRSIKTGNPKKKKKKNPNVCMLQKNHTGNFSSVIPGDSSRFILSALEQPKNMYSPSRVYDKIRQSILIVAESSCPFLCCVQTESDEVSSRTAVISCTRICGVFRFHTKLRL